MGNGYDYWAKYIAKGRNKLDRPIHGSRTKRAYLYADGRIGLRLHYTDVVTLYPDGTEVINTGGWNTVTTKAFIAEHSKARAWSKKGQLFVRTLTPEITAPRVQKCRECKGTGEVPQTCPGPGYCYPYYFAGVDRDRTCEHGQTATHLRETCPHGQTEAHGLSAVGCYQCKGEGRCDYGSKAVHYKWDGNPLRIDADGYPLGPANTATASAIGWHAGAAPTAHQVAGTSYNDSGSLLSAPLPALATRVQCPHCDTWSGAIDQTVIHLNDSAKWTREQVADWLDSLDVDLSFPVPDTIPAHIH